jgi:hypothetical protein
LAPEELPLRGFLLCPKCGYKLTGSASKGYSKRYYYYHCFAKCKVRYSAKKVNDAFLLELENYTLDPRAYELYNMIISQVYNSISGGEKDESSKLKLKIEDLNKKMIRARDKMLDDVILDFEYRKIKIECEKSITILEGKLLEISKGNLNLSPIIAKATGMLANLLKTYLNADSDGKRRLISSMYPENLTFDGTSHRTVRINEAMRVLSSLKGVLEGKKKGQIKQNFDLPTMVESTIRKSNFHTDFEDTIHRIEAYYKKYGDENLYQ